MAVTKGYIFLHKRAYVKLGSHAFDELSLVFALNGHAILDGECRHSKLCINCFDGILNDVNIQVACVCDRE